MDGNVNNINWFPGHMAKTRRIIQENLKKVDLAIEIIDARIPDSSKNPEIEKLTAQKPKLTIASKCSLADPAVTKLWKESYSKDGKHIVFYDCKTGEGIAEIMEEARKICSEKLDRWTEKGMEGRSIKAMIIGIPNVGKSSLINKLAAGKKAKVENRPGVTTVKQWVATNIGIDLLDMPGILWPKLEDKTGAENLAITGAIKDDILDIEHMAGLLCGRLRDMYPNLLKERYKLEDDEITDRENYEIFEIIGRKRGFLVKGGDIDYERTAKMLLEEFRNGKIGRITLERP